MDDKIKNLYQSLFEKFGVSPEAVKARDAKQQYLRFKHLIDLAEINQEDSVLDIGCGSGELLTYLRKNNFNGQYCGIDFIPSFVDHANRVFESDDKAKFINKNIISDKFNEKFDWVILSGVFNDRRDDSETFFYNTIKKMYETCTKGIVFNSLSKFVDYEDDSLFYTYPDITLKYCIENLSKYTVLNTNYQLKENVIPFEYSTCIFKK